MKDILYLAAGDSNSTSMMRAHGLLRLGHRVRVVNCHELMPRSIWLRRIDNWTGYALAQSRTANWIHEKVGCARFDIAWVDGGAIAGPKVIQELKTCASYIVNYNHDDPTGKRDGRVWDSFRKAIPLYDLMVTVREESERELRSMGARRVIRVWRGYDEEWHRPSELDATDYDLWRSKTIFVGAWMPERGPFLADLLRRGVPLVIYGDHWKRAKEWKVLRQAWRGGAIYGRDYVKAIQCAEIALGLVSRGNRDRHTQRTAEIPYIGGAVLCAERTDEHQNLFLDGKEAVFWSSVEECAGRCLQLLHDEQLRKSIARAGKSRVEAWRLSHGEILAAVLRAIDGLPVNHELVTGDIASAVGI